MIFAQIYDAYSIEIDNIVKNSKFSHFFLLSLPEICWNILYNFMYLLSAPYVKTSLSNIKGGIQMERNWPLLTSHQIQCPVWPLTRGTGDSFVLPRRNRWQFGTPSRAMTNMSCYHSKNIYFSDARHYSQIDISVISISGFNFGSSQFIELLYLSML